MEIFKKVHLFDNAINVCQSLAKNSESKKLESKKSLENALINALGGNDIPKEFIDNFYDIYKGFKETIENGRDTIWKFILQNIYKPLFLKERFEFVVGNPPWFTYSSIKNEEYQNQLKNLAVSYSVMPERRANFPHLEIAAVFLAHCASYFLKKDGKMFIDKPTIRV